MNIIYKSIIFKYCIFNKLINTKIQKKLTFKQSDDLI